MNQAVLDIQVSSSSSHLSNVFCYPSKPKCRFISSFASISEDEKANSPIQGCLTSSEVIERTDSLSSLDGKSKGTKLSLSCSIFLPSEKTSSTFFGKSEFYVFNQAKTFSFEDVSRMTGLKFSNATKKKKRTKRHTELLVKEGDWSCKRCKNLNFAFREHCNRCLR